MTGKATYLASKAIKNPYLRRAGKVGAVGIAAAGCLIPIAIMGKAVSDSF